jgi:hypothetical protein
MIELGPLLRDTVRLMVQSGWRLFVAMAVLTMMSLFADLSVDPANQRGVDLLIGGATLFFQIWLTVSLLAAHGQRRGRRGVGTVFGISILNGLGVLLGLVLLVIPGIVLLVRWTIAIPYALGEDAGVTDSLQGSFEETRGAFWPILLALLVAYLPCLLALGTAAFYEGEGITIATSLISNGLINIGLLAGWHVAVAVYLTHRGDAGLSNLFA